MDDAAQAKKAARVICEALLNPDASAETLKTFGKYQMAGKLLAEQQQEQQQQHQQHAQQKPGGGVCTLSGTHRLLERTHTMVASLEQDAVESKIGDVGVVVDNSDRFVRECRASSSFYTLPRPNTESFFNLRMPTGDVDVDNSSSSSSALLLPRRRQRTDDDHNNNNNINSESDTQLLLREEASRSTTQRTTISTSTSSTNTQQQHQQQQRNGAASSTAPPRSLFELNKPVVDGSSFVSYIATCAHVLGKSSLMKESGVVGVNAPTCSVSLSNGAAYAVSHVAVDVLLSLLRRCQCYSQCALDVQRLKLEPPINVTRQKIAVSGDVPRSLALVRRAIASCCRIDGDDDSNECATCDAASRALDLSRMRTIPPVAPVVVHGGEDGKQRPRLFGRLNVTSAVARAAIDSLQ